MSREERRREKELSRGIVGRGKRRKKLTLSHVPDTDRTPAAPLFSENLQLSAWIIMCKRSGGRAWDWP